MAKRNRALWVIGGLVALMVASPLILRAYRSAQAAREYAKELELARSEGLPTTGEEFAKLMPEVDPVENAAPLYAKLRGLGGSGADFQSLAAKLTYQAAADVVEEAERRIRGHQAELKIAEDATHLPKCRFDRDWSLGAAVLMPEISEMRSLARLLALRGSLFAHRGDVRSALADIERIRKIADHTRMEVTAIGMLAAESVDQTALTSLAGWGHVHRDQPAYRKALARIIEEWPRPDVKAETRGGLFETLSIIDLCATAEGRAALGLKKEDLPGIERYSALLFDKGEARVTIVRAYRARRAALDLPPGKRHATLEEAALDVQGAMMAFPTANRVFFMLTGSQSEFLDQRELIWEANLVRWRGLARALEPPRPPAKIKVDDLLSPFDGTPLDYRFDGKQMGFTISGANRTLLIPPDSALAKP